MKIGLLTIGGILLMGSVSVIGIQETFAIHATDGEVTADEIGEVDMETGEVKQEAAADEEDSNTDDNARKSGFDHGCEDSSISDIDERYISQEGKGPENHTSEFMSGYEEGFDECYNDNDNRPANVDSLPRCDGSFQDCLTQRGDICRAGEKSHECEI